MDYNAYHNQQGGLQQQQQQQPQYTELVTKYPDASGRYANMGPGKGNHRNYNSAPSHPPQPSPNWYSQQYYGKQLQSPADVYGQMCNQMYMGMNPMYPINPYMTPTGPPPPAFYGSTSGSQFMQSAAAMQHMNNVMAFASGAPPTAFHATDPRNCANANPSMYGMYSMNFPAQPPPQLLGMRK